MKRIRISVREVDEDAWWLLKDIRDDERTVAGKVISDAIRMYADEYYGEEHAEIELAA